MRYTKNELEKLILEEKKSYEYIGRMFGVTGSAIRRIAKRMGISLPNRRTVNSSENFRHYGPRNNLVNNASDEHFAYVVENFHSWSKIGIELGYNSKNLSPEIKSLIKKRCDKIGINQPLISLARECLSMTKGELFSSRRNWQSARSQIQRHARQCYFSMTPHPQCHVCGYDKHVEVAHLRAVSDFDDNTLIKDINNINNLIGLCPNHHWEYDNGLLTL